MRKGMHVLTIAQRYTPAIGGVEKHLDRVVEELSKLGTEITILTSSHTPELSRQEQKGNVRILRLPYGWDRNPPLVYLWIFANRREFKGYHVVHIHDTLPFLLWCFPLLIMNSATPIYATFHGFERNPVPTIFNLLRKVARRLVRGSICIGRFIPEVYGVTCDVVLRGTADRVDLTEQPRNGAILVRECAEDS